jgi:hypothetical protein
MIALSGIGKRESGIDHRVNNPPNGYEIALARQRAAQGRNHDVPNVVLASDPENKSGFSKALRRRQTQGR